VPVTHRHQFIALSINRQDGSVRWKKVLREEWPHEGGHNTGSLASSSPVTDGEHLYAFFGSRGLYCLNPKGEVIWSKDLGRMRTLHSHGEGSSPVLHGDALVVCWDQEGDSFLHAFDKHTGKQLWKVVRYEKTSWSTPLVVEHRGKFQVIISATQRIRAYDFITGDVVWECGGLPRNVVASPVAAHGMVIAGNSYDTQRMVAIRLEGAKGDITDTAQIAWTLNRLTPYVPSPVLYDNTLYFIRHNQGILSCLNPVTGEFLTEPIRLPAIRNAFASPVAADQRLYLLDREGATTVLRHGGDRAILAVNRLDDVFTASPVPVDRELYLRGQGHLYRIEDLNGSRTRAGAD
jgi:outer membrane protein assembly factor BamB